MNQTLSTAVVLASAGRPELLADALSTVAAQRDVTFRTVVSVPDAESLPHDRSLLDGMTVVTGTRGLAAQRNAGIEALPSGTQVVAFFDDDAVLRPDWLVVAVDFFQQHPRVVGLTGRVLLDGATVGEVSRERTNDALAESEGEPFLGTWEHWRELYGCNFAIRLDLIGTERFDARLPLYSWLEDHDMARRLLRHGQLARVHDCVIVHRGAASGGRQSHLRLGYSQVMNPMYLHHKGSFGLLRSLDHLGRRVAKNAVGAVSGDGRQWRRERLRGNALALADVLRSRRTPERITTLSAPGEVAPNRAIEVRVAPWTRHSLRRWLRLNLLESVNAHRRAFSKRSEWHPVTVRAGLRDAGVVVVMTVRDEALRLPHHLAYYRALGADHFVVVDNESEDDVAGLLADEQDVSVFRAVGDYGSARYAVDWVNGILARYCVGKWILWVDADELLVFSDREDVTLRDLVERLTTAGRASLQTMMLDLYSDRPPSENRLSPGQDPREVCDRFDACGYRQTLSRDNHAAWIKGGVRERLFFADDPAAGPALNKTPLVRWRRHYAFMRGVHQLWPNHLNGGTRLTGVLLHFKFTHIAAAKIVDPDERVQHTAEYDAYGNDLSAVRATEEWGTRYEGVAQLKALGLIDPYL